MEDCKRETFFSKYGTLVRRTTKNVTWLHRTSDNWQNTADCWLLDSDNSQLTILTVFGWARDSNLWRPSFKSWGRKFPIKNGRSHFIKIFSFWWKIFENLQGLGTIEFTEFIWLSFSVPSKFSKFVNESSSSAMHFFQTSSVGRTMSASGKSFGLNLISLDSLLIKAGSVDPDR